MKKDDIVSISGSGKGTKIKIKIFAFFLIFIVTTSLYIFSTSQNLNKCTIHNIYFKSVKGDVIKKSGKFKPLLDFKEGDTFSYKKNRKSMESLYKTGLFSNIKTKVEKLKGEKLNLYFEIYPKYSIHAIKIIEIKKNNRIKKKNLLDSIFSLRKETWFEEANLKAAVRELKHFLDSRGYFNPEITYKIHKDDSQAQVDILFFIEPGGITTINKVFLTVPNRKILKEVKGYFAGSQYSQYIPFEFRNKIEKVEEKLKVKKYYFPEVTLKENFTDETKSKVNLDVIIKPGYRYEFKFHGIKNKIDLIASIWEKKVFEKWAEKESKARILYYLKNKGFLNAEVESFIKVEKFVKHITFRVKKNKKYRLGKINFTGNKNIPDSQLEKITKTDNLFFDKYLWLRSKSLRADQEVLQLFYYFKGFPSSKIYTQPHFRNKKVDIHFVIDEGKKYTVDSILFNGNQGFKSDTLYKLLKTQNNGAFVQQILNEDIERLRNFYLSRGFNTVKITLEISPGTEKSILITIDEGPSYRIGNLIIVGASKSQKALIRKLFPLKPNAQFNQLKIETFRSHIESSSIFKEFNIVKLEKTGNIIDVLIKVKPDRSRYYGFGIGWEERKGPRISLEYQERDILNSYSSLSAIFQLGTLERRGIISYDTPYFFGQRINSEFKLWADNEIFPSYQFFRYGLGESIIKKLTGNSYVMASLSWYRTELTELEINPSGVDQLETPFDTTAFHLSYEKENRDDPFNPTRGYFFSSDIKVGIPLLEENYSFIKFRWRFQKNFKFLKNGTLTFSVRNGLASGDMSVTERFFAGGPNSFRGVRTDRLGPIDTVIIDMETNEVANKPKGGNALLLMNLEATFLFPIPVIPGYNLYYSFFADVGNVFEKVPDISIKQLKRAIGFSLKIKTPLGPVWGSVAWNMDRGFFILSGGIGNVF
jgi:outer membrane protein insertion porin family